LKIFFENDPFLSFFKKGFCVDLLFATTHGYSPQECDSSLKGNMKHKKRNTWESILDTKIKGGILLRMPDFRGRILPVVLVDPDLSTPEHPEYATLGIVNTKLEQFLETVYTSQAVFYSKSRKCRWKKGEKESGNILSVRDILINCYGNSLLYVVKQSHPEVGFCHTGKPTCFYRSVFCGEFEGDGHSTLSVIPM